jgi:hypothetical protein
VGLAAPEELSKASPDHSVGLKAAAGGARAVFWAGILRSGVTIARLRAGGRGSTGPGGSFLDRWDGSRRSGWVRDGLDELPGGAPQA